MEVYRFVGSGSCVVGDDLEEFDCVGSKLTADEQTFREIVVGGGAFIPEKDFLQIGFSERELEEYGPSGIRIDPPTSFTTKLDLAQETFRRIRSEFCSQLAHA